MDMASVGVIGTGIMGDLYEAEIIVHDPYVYDEQVETVLIDFKSVVKGTDALVVFTGHSQYRNLDAHYIRLIMADGTPVVDGRNILDADQFIREGFVYRGVGRGDLNR